MRLHVPAWLPSSDHQSSYIVMMTVKPQHLTIRYKMQVHLSYCLKGKSIYCWHREVSPDGGRRDSGGPLLSASPNGAASRKERKIFWTKILPIKIANGLGLAHSAALYIYMLYHGIRNSRKIIGFKCTRLNVRVIVFMSTRKVQTCLRLFSRNLQIGSSTLHWWYVQIYIKSHSKCVKHG